MDRTDSPPRSPKALHSSSKYCVRFREKSIEADTLGDVLVKSLRAVEAEVPGTLFTLSRMTRGKRRIVARRKEDLYPGSRHLSEYARRVNEHWFVGTNYSREDVKIILVHVSVSAGLKTALTLVKRGEPAPPTLEGLLN